MSIQTFRLAIIFVGLTLIVSVMGIIYLALETQPIPDVLQNVSIGALTGLVGLLAVPKE